MEAPDPLTENFDTVGFGTTTFLFNLGSLTFAVISFPFIAVLAYILKNTGVKAMIKKGLSWERNLYWNNQIFII